MTEVTRVLIDERLINEKIVEAIKKARRNNKKSISFNDNFFSYLESHPSTGMITNQTKEIIERKYWGPYQSRSEKRLQQIYELDEMLNRFLRVEYIEYSRFQENMEKVNKFFKGLLENQKQMIVANRYRDLVDSLGITEKYTIAPEEKDKKCLAEGVSLSNAYKQLFLASENPLFMKPYVSNKIEEEFNLTPGDTDFILTKLSK
jgi:hypothetical protein